MTGEIINNWDCRAGMTVVSLQQEKIHKAQRNEKDNKPSLCFNYGLYDNPGTGSGFYRFRIY